MGSAPDGALRAADPNLKATRQRKDGADFIKQNPDVQCCNTAGAAFFKFADFLVLESPRVSKPGQDTAPVQTLIRHRGALRQIFCQAR